MLYVDYDVDYTLIILDLAQSRGITWGFAQTVDNALSQISQYESIVFHFDTSCSDKLKQRYFERMGWLTVFQQPRFRDRNGNLNPNTIPGGAVLMTHLHCENYQGTKIMITGIPDSDVRPFQEDGLVDHIIFKPFMFEEIENLIIREGQMKNGRT